MKNFLSALWILIITLGTGLVWYATESGWLADTGFGKNWLSITHSPVVKQKVFVPKNSENLSLGQARSLYKRALALKTEERWEEAIAEFNRLKEIYPGLGDVIRLHLAEIHEELGREMSVQNNLKTAIKSFAGSPLMPKLLYELAQSQYRGNEPDNAAQTFDRIIKQHPHSDYALASHYFMANLKNRKNGSKDEIIQHLTTYLSECPDCTFSGDSAEKLGELIPSPTQEQHKLIGQGLANGNQSLSHALEHLKKAPTADVWKELGKVLYKKKHYAEAKRILTSGLPLTKDMDEVRWAVDSILSASSGHKLATLKELDSKKIPFGGDYILWKLSTNNTSNRNFYYQQILERYPHGDYAPESSWALLWPSLKNRNFSHFATRGEQHVKNYPYARSTPKVLFWLAKIQENKGSYDFAKSNYEKLIANFPNDYYAFRATGRLNKLNSSGDTGWKTKPGRTDYPPADFNVSTALLSGITFHDSWHLERLTELFNIGASGDVKLMVKEATGKVPARIESWHEHQIGNRARGIRIIRDDIYERYKPTASNPVETYTYPIIAKEELKLLYPVYFSDELALYASQNNVDPYIAQGLMREESYFNEFAVSSSNARGLMQLLPATAREVAGWEKMTGFQTVRLFQPEVNVQLGTRYLSHINQFLGNNHMLMVGAYNGGPNAMKRWSTSSPYINTDSDMFVEMIPYEQTRNYIKKVYGSYWNYTRLYGAE